MSGALAYRWMERWMERWMDGWIDRSSSLPRASGEGGDGGDGGDGGYDGLGSLGLTLRELLAFVVELER